MVSSMFQASQRGKRLKQTSFVPTDGMVLLWIPSDAPASSFNPSFDDDGDAEFAKEHWRLRTMSRASSSETYDMAWSPSGDALVIGGTDFVARIINANDGE